MWRLRHFADRFAYSGLPLVTVYAVTVLIIVSATVAGTVRVMDVLEHVASQATGLDDPRAEFEDAIAELQTVGENAGGVWSSRGQTSSPEAIKAPQSGAGSVLATIDEATRSDSHSAEPGDAFSRAAGTYRTVCVRLCDGYYWPVSFSTTQEFFARDKQACESSCGMPASLYVQRSPGVGTDDMTSLAGESYSRLRTAYQFRVRYDAGCSCRGQPWDAAAMKRHLDYAFEVDAKKAAREASANVKGSRKERREAVAAARAEVEAAYDAKAAAVDQHADAAEPGAATATATPAVTAATDDGPALSASASERIVRTTNLLVSDAERHRLAKERAEMESTMRLGGPGSDRESSRTVTSPYRSGPVPLWEHRAFSGN